MNASTAKNQKPWSSILMGSVPVYPTFSSTATKADGGRTDFLTTQLAVDLCAPGYSTAGGKRFHGSIILESKDDLKSRGEASPDDGDTLVSTFSIKQHPLDELKFVRRTCLLFS